MSKLIASEVIAAHGRPVGLRRNAVQGEYADYVQRGIAVARKARHGQLFAEAETGTGKTIGYLVAAALDCVAHHSRAIVATHTIALQRQILRFDPNGRVSAECDMARALAIVKSATGVQLTGGLRLGRRNFLDTDRALKAIGRVVGKRGLKRDAREAAEAFQEWSRLNPGAQIQTFLEENDLPALPGGLLFEDVCVTGSSRKSEVSYLKYLEHVAASKRADILVTNHPMVMANSVRGRNRLLHAEDDDREVGVLIIDECDRFETTARSSTSDLVPITPLAGALADWSSTHHGKTVKAAQDAVERLRQKMAELRTEDDDARAEEVQLWDELNPSDRRAVYNCLESASEALDPFLCMKEKSETLDTIQDYAEALRAVTERVGRTSSEGDAVVALRWSPTRHYPSIRTFRLRPARALKRMWDLWTGPDAEEREEDPFRAKALVLTSATIGVPTDSGRASFAEMSSVYGVYGKSNACNAMNVSGEGVFAPKKFGAVDFVFAHPGAPAVYLNDVDACDDSDETRFEFNPKWVQYTAHAIRAAHARGGRTLVLTNSYRAAEAICACLRKGKDALEPIEKTANTNQELCVRAFVADPNGALVSPSAWEGFDISQRIGPDGKKLGTGAIKHVVITQLPFSAPDGPFGRAVERDLRRRGYSESQARGVQFTQFLAEAVRKFKQGFGRGIRGPQDSFTLWLTDPRIPRSELADTLPNPHKIAQRVEPKFRFAIPKRFRSSVRGDSPWDCGSVLMLDGTVLDADAIAGEADAA
ncbi:MAG: ATP-dependent DNA helicase [Steroidobacteraceae bacterium]